MGIKLIQDQNIFLSIHKGRRKVMWATIMIFLTTFAMFLSYHMLLDYGYQTVLEYEHEHDGPGNVPNFETPYFFSE